MAQDFFSSHAINDTVEFVPMFRQQQALGISSDQLEGKIMAVRFTEAKVFYDIYSNYWGKLFEEVSSEKVWKTVSSDKKVPASTSEQ